MRLKRTESRGEGLNMPHELLELIRNQDRISDEIQQALEDTPDHQELGLEADKWTRILSGVPHHRNLNTKGINQIQEVLAAVLGHIQKLK